MADKEPQVREPTTEIMETPEGASITVELPGVAQDAIKIAVSKDILKLEAEGVRGKFSTIQALPFEPDPDGISVTFSQGVLEIILGRKPDNIIHEGERNVPILSPIEVSLEHVEKELELLRNELFRVSEERTTLEDRVAFLQKDFQNLKRRHEGEKESIADRKIEELGIGLIDVLDSFRLAKGSMTNPTKGSSTADQMVKGIEIIETQVMNLFQRLGIVRMVVNAQHFDHNFHEAVGFVERSDIEDEVVTEEVKAGYLYKGRAFRPAQVIVNRKPAKGGKAK